VLERKPARPHGIMPVDLIRSPVLHRIVAGVPRPADAPFAQRSGGRPHRILIVGGGATAGRWVSHSRLALAGLLAQEVTSLTGSRVEVEVVTDPAMTIRSAAAVVAETLRFAPYDVVLISAGMPGVSRLWSGRPFGRRLTALLETATAWTSPAVSVVLVGPKPVRAGGPVGSVLSGLLDRRARRLAAIGQAVVGQFPNASYVELAAPQAGHPASHPSRAWVKSIAAHVVAALRAAESSRVTVAAEEPGEAARLEALEALSLMDTAPEERFDRIAHLARRVLGTEFAAVTLVDGRRRWMKSAAGMEPDEVPCDQSYCQFTIRAAGATLILDTRRDPRTRDIAPTRDGVAFYAGYPLRSADGHVVGALCVFDSAPREREFVDTELLRDVALLAQRELWKTPAQEPLFAPE
jgi:hypothetical protein